MLFSNLFLRCSTTGNIKGINKAAWPKWAFLFSGLVATLWFVLRVVPKPSRITYPCQKVSASFMVSFLVYIGSLAGSVFAFRKARVLLKNSKVFYGLLFLLLSGISMLVFISNHAHPAVAAANAPVGTAKGIFPGRVTWVYNPNAAMWRGTGNYWAANVNPQAEYNKAFTAGIKNLSGGTDDSTSWDKIFKYFNANHNRIGTGYQKGDSIAIKVNQNNAAASANDYGNVSNANPQSAVAVIASLVNAGVPQGEIIIGDPSRIVTENIFTAIHTLFPNVRVVDYKGGGNGRVTTTNTSGVFMTNPDGGVKNMESSCFYNARYIINQPLMKGHSGGGITFGSKNFFGITGLKPDWTQNGGHPGNASLTGFMTAPNFGGKVVLWCMDAMYPNQNLDGTPNPNWAEAPFNGKPASSFIMSLDGVAEESVSFDFFYQHYQSEVDANSGYTGASQYIVNAAQATPSAGVQEHWNNNTARQYSRNLDPVNGKGIELAYVNTSTVTGTTPAETGIAGPKNIDIVFCTAAEAHVALPAGGDCFLSVFGVSGAKIGDIVLKQGSKGDNVVSLARLHLSRGAYVVKLKSNGDYLEKQITISR